MQKVLEESIKLYKWLGSLLDYHDASELGGKSIPLERYNAIDQELRISTDSEFDTPDPLKIWRWWMGKGITVDNKVEFEEYVMSVLHILDQHSYRVTDGREKGNTHKVETDAGTLVIARRRWWDKLYTNNFSVLKNEVPLSLFSLQRLALVKDKRKMWGDDEFIEFHFPKVKEKVLIGLCPMLQEIKTIFETTVPGFRSGGKFMGFRTKDVASDHPENLKIYKQYLKDSINWALYNRVNILCFPEMSVCEEGKSLLRQLIKTAAIPNESLSLILPGSFHTINESGIWKNTTPIWEIKDKEIIERTNYNKVELLSLHVANRLGEITDNSSIGSLVETAQSQDLDILSEDVTPDSRVVILDSLFGKIGVLICR